MAIPHFGEVWHAPEGSVLPGGMLCLIVSNDDYHRTTRRYVIVEVMRESLTGDTIICDLGESLGVALTGAPFTVGTNWFAGSDEPIAVLPPQLARRAVDQIKDNVLGP
ncbi:hypothetical protein ACWIGW_44740 [Nocardia brasiliensis]|uniref:hypothetical protein n=1 Tax=Streptomyces sp. NPDC056056 TaxID=3345698 RepID=UPI0035DECD69